MKYTVCFLFSPDGKSVLMTRKKKTSYKNRLNGVGGKIEDGESPIRGAQREILEETGVELKFSDLYWLATTHLPVDCAVEPGDPPETCELHFYGAIVDPSKVRFDTGEDLSWQDTDTVMHARPQDERFAGDGDTPYIVNMAVKLLGFNIESVSIFYNILIGEDGDDYIYQERVPAHEVNTVKDKINQFLKPGAYIKTVPYN